MSPRRVLCGRYEVGGVIGRGGMTDVHLGRDIHSGRWVAIKILRKSLAEDPTFRSSLQREAQTMRRLRHRGIVALHDTGYDVGDGSADEHAVPFIVMEYVAGWSLRDLLGMGGLTLAKSIQYQVGVLSALEAAHRAGIVHRDIKPANVMVTAAGRREARRLRHRVPAAARLRPPPTSRCSSELPAISLPSRPAARPRTRAAISTRPAVSSSSCSPDGHPSPATTRSLWPTCTSTSDPRAPIQASPLSTPWS